MIQRNQGSALLLILILLAVLGFHVWLLQNHFSHLIESLEWFTHSQRAHHKANSKAFESLDQIKSGGIDCKEVKTYVGKSSRRQMICSNNFTTEDYEFARSQSLLNGEDQVIPAFNFSNLLRNNSECNEIQPVNFPLHSDGAVLARSNCIIRNDIPNNLIILHNLIYRGSSQIRLGDSSWTVVGLIDIRMKIIARGTVTVIAGGNITLFNLECAPSATVLIVSATGKVQLENFSGSPCLKVISKRAPLVPLASLYPHSALPPPLPLQVLSIYPPWFDES